jgi:hypothetical protein
MQIVLVIITVLLALSYLGYKGFKAFFSKKTSCDGCAFSKTTESLK